MIEVSHLTKRYGKVLAVDDLSFRAEPGRVTGFLGPNGAGKTTTLRALVALLHPTSGSATVLGRPYPALERIVSSDWPWEHIEEGEENAPTHIRAAFMGPDVVVPVRGGKLALGTWQGIFFCEFDGPRERSVYVTTLS